MSDLYRIRGFRSRKPDAMTREERVRKWMRGKDHRRMQIPIPPDIAASLIYLRQQWGIESTAETVRASIRFLTLCTRQGLTVLPQSLDD